VRREAIRPVAPGSVEEKAALAKMGLGLLGGVN